LTIPPKTGPNIKLGSGGKIFRRRQVNRPKKCPPELIIRKLREAEVLIAEGMTAAEAARKSGVGTLYIEPGSLWENGYIESFNGKLRDEVLSREVFDTLLGARKYLWSDGDENTIIYDHIIHRDIDLLPRRSLSRWERRCLVPLRSASYLRFETNSTSGTKYGGWSIYDFT